MRTIGVIAGFGIGATAKYADEVADLSDDVLGSVYKKKLDIDHDFKGFNLDENSVFFKNADDVTRDVKFKSGSGSYSLLSREGDIGTYRDLLDAGEIGDNITPHHMPSAEYMSQYGVGKKDSLCMNVEMPSPGTGGRHRLTDAYGRNMTDAEKAYYYSLSPRDALAYDIANVREIYQSQGLYSEMRPKLQEYIKQYKELIPELFGK